MYGKASQSRFSIKFKHHSLKVCSQFQTQSLMPEISSKPDKEEVLRKRYQFVCLTGLHKWCLSQRVSSKRKKRDGTCLRDLHISVLVYFHFHSCRSKHDRWVRDVYKKQKVFGWHLSAFCNRTASLAVHNLAMKRNKPEGQGLLKNCARDIALCVTVQTSLQAKNKTRKNSNTTQKNLSYDFW